LYHLTNDGQDSLGNKDYLDTFPTEEQSVLKLFKPYPSLTEIQISKKTDIKGILLHRVLGHLFHIGLIDSK